jgi:hypothetical protein
MAKKPGKYDAVIGELDPVPVDDQRAQEKINTFKEQVKAKVVHTPESLAQAYRELRQGTGNPIDADFTETLIELLGDDGVDDLQKVINIRKMAYEQMLAESHDNDEPGWGMYGASEHGIRLPDGGSVSIQREPTGKVVDKEAFRRWCIANGLETSLQLWPSTANSIVKDRCVNGMPAPDGIKVFALTKTVLWKGSE